MFSYNDEYEMNIAEINDVIIACEEVEDSYEELAQETAEKYSQKLDEIVQFMIDEGICEYFGEVSADEIKSSLGKPLIDIENQLVQYLEHTLDETHIIEIEYDDDFEEFLCMNIDG